MTADQVRAVLRADELFDMTEHICICSDPPRDKNPNCYYEKTPQEQYEMRIAFILSEVA